MLFRFQIYVRAIVLITKHNHKILTSFIKNNRRYNRLNTTKWISILTTLLSADWLARYHLVVKSKTFRNLFKEHAYSLDFWNDFDYSLTKKGTCIHLVFSKFYSWQFQATHANKCLSARCIHMDICCFGVEVLPGVYDLRQC